MSQPPDMSQPPELNPHIFRLLGDIAGRTILDAGCGQGYLSRLLAEHGAKVTGVEPADVLYRYAVARERGHRQGIRYVRASLAEATGLRGRFDAVVSNVVLQGIPDWVPALRTCVHALRPGGLLVLALEHPCFTVGSQSYLREHERPQRYGLACHRPLSTYLNQVIELGCVLTEVTEPTLDLIIIAARRPGRG